MPRIFLILTLSSLLLPICRADDAAQAAANTRLREALRAATQQVNDAQTQLAAAQATQAQSEKDNADLKAKTDALTAQIATLTQQSADQKAASDKAVADLNAKAAEASDQIAKLQESLAAWKTGYAQKDQLANAKEAARAQLAGQVILLKRLVDDREFKNLELYRTGSEILTRYEKFSLGDAIGAREPFVGITRVKLQTLVQDYKDKLLDGTVTPGQPPTTPPAAPAHSAPVSAAEKSVTKT